MAVKAVEDEIEVKFMKSVLLYSSQEIDQRIVRKEDSVNEVVVVMTVRNRANYSFSNDMCYLKKRIETCNTTKEQCILFFEPWILQGLNFVFYGTDFDTTGTYVIFFLQTNEKDIIHFRDVSSPADNQLWFNLTWDISFFPPFTIFMKENLEKMKARQMLLKHQMNNDDCAGLPIVLYNLIAEYTIGFV